MRWFVVAACMAVAAEARAEELEDGGRESWDGVEVAGGCGSGMQQQCQCPSGAWSTQTCDVTGIFSLCACGSAGVKVPKVPSFKVPDIDFSSKPPEPPRWRQRPSGQGMLIGGLITLVLGCTSLGIGVTLLREDTVIPLGVVLTATGGTAMAVGLPLSIVGLVRVVERGDNRGWYYGAEDPLVGAPAEDVWVGPGSFGFSF